jgi:hypothetical protein
VLLAAVVVVAERNLEIASGVVYALAGFFLGLLVVAGPLFAFGTKTFKRGGPMQVDVAARGARHDHDGNSATESDAAVTPNGLEQGLIAGNYPVCVSAHGAWVLVEGGESSLDPLDIHGTPA